MPYIKRTAEDYDRLKAEAVAMYRDGKSRNAIATQLAISLGLVNRSLVAAGLWDGEKQNTNEAGWEPSPEYIASECRKIRIRNGHLTEEEIEEMRA